MGLPEEQYEEILRGLVPIGELSAEQREEVLRTAQVQAYAKGDVVFRQGDRDGFAIYLVEGQLALYSEGRVVKRVAAGTEAARYALAHLQPRQYSGRAESPVTALYVDRRLLNLAGGQVGPTEMSLVPVQVGEIASADSGDWMTRLLKSDLFTRIPAMNLQRLFSTLESVQGAAGETLVRQGDTGDFFYVLVRGRCQVSRQSAAGREVVLAELRDGDSFGEEALIGGTSRTATVKMLTDGELVRLGREDFVELVCKPVLRAVSYAEACRQAEHGATWLDVRFPDEHGASGIDGSVNLPLNLLRLQAGRLDRHRKHLVYCDTGSRSAVAAFLLAQRGFDVRYLEGGLLAASSTSEPTVVSQPEPPGSPAPTAEPGSSQGGSEQSLARIEGETPRALSRQLERRLSEEQTARRAEIARHRDELGRLRSLLELGETRLQELQQRAVGERATLLDEVERAKAARGAAETTLDTLRRDTSSRIAELEEQVATRTALADAAQRAAADQRAALEEERRRTAEQVALRSEAERAREAARADLDAGREAWDGARVALERAHAAALAASGEALRQACEDLEELRHRSAAELAAQRESLTAQTVRAETAEAALADARGSLAETQGELQGRLQAAEQQTLDAEERAREWAARAAELESTVDRLGQELRESRDARRSETSRLEERLAALAAERAQGEAARRAEQERLAARVAELESRLEAKDREVVAGREEAAALRSRAEDLDARVAGLTASLADAHTLRESESREAEQREKAALARAQGAEQAVAAERDRGARAAREAADLEERYQRVAGQVERLQNALQEAEGRHRAQQAEAERQLALVRAKAESAERTLDGERRRLQAALDEARRQAGEGLRRAAEAAAQSARADESGYLSEMARLKSDLTDALARGDALESDLARLLAEVEQRERETESERAAATAREAATEGELAALRMTLASVGDELCGLRETGRRAEERAATAARERQEIEADRDRLLAELRDMAEARAQADASAAELRDSRARAGEEDVQTRAAARAAAEQVDELRRRLELQAAAETAALEEARHWRESAEKAELEADHRIREREARFRAAEEGLRREVETLRRALENARNAADAKGAGSADPSGAQPGPPPPDTPAAAAPRARGRDVDRTLVPQSVRESLARQRAALEHARRTDHT
jgi:CRP-like cAMP-binding protein/chromosome segregation ATPase